MKSRDNWKYLDPIPFPKDWKYLDPIPFPKDWKYLYLRVS